MNEEPYLINGTPSSANDILNLAKEYGYDDVIKFTSVAAKILRERGFAIENNPGYKNKETR